MTGQSTRPSRDELDTIYWLQVMTICNGMICFENKMLSKRKKINLQTLHNDSLIKFL